MPNIPKEYNYKWMHDRGRKPCNQVAYYCKGKMESTDLLESRRIIKSDGTFPLVGDVIMCSNCYLALSPKFDITQVKR